MDEVKSDKREDASKKVDENFKLKQLKEARSECYEMFLLEYV